VTQANGHRDVKPADVLPADPQWLPVSAFRPWARNPRKNDGAPVEKVARSLERFGFVAPIVVWRSAGRMVAGHTRLKALTRILADNPGFTPKGAPGPGLARVVFHEFASEQEADAYALADNRLAEEAEWDDEILRAIQDDVGPELTALAGFTDEDITRLRDDVDAPPADDDAPDPPKDPVTKPGDLWTLGRHRLVCGDSLDPAVVQRACAGKLAALLWTDPPYNVAVVGGCREDSIADRKAQGFKTIDNDSMSEVVNFRLAVVEAKWKIAQTLVWVKDSFVLCRQDYHWRHEPILYGWKEGAGHRQLEDRSQDTVWEFPRPSRNAEHPTQKPIALIDRALKNSSLRNDLVLDTFGGSGSTLIACEQSERVCATVELDPGYCDVIVERWKKLTGGVPVRQGS
jgi:DNA modification methylase